MPSRSTACLLEADVHDRQPLAEQRSSQCQAEPLIQRLVCPCQDVSPKPASVSAASVAWSSNTTAPKECHHVPSGRSYRILMETSLPDLATASTVIDDSPRCLTSPANAF